jgi:aminoglycoside phosphotransferase family enzyme
LAIARPILLRRGEAGFTRRCHGDLHLRNIVLINGDPTLFDAVEFSDGVASGDVLYDLAFLLMDLEERGLRASANRLFNRAGAAGGYGGPRHVASFPEPARCDPSEG